MAKFLILILSVFALFALTHGQVEYFLKQAHSNRQALPIPPVPGVPPVGPLVPGVGPATTTAHPPSVTWTPLIRLSGTSSGTQTTAPTAGF